MTHDEKPVTKILDLLNSESKGINIKMFSKKKGKLKSYSMRIEEIGIFILSKQKSRRKVQVNRFISYFVIFKINFLPKNQIEIFYKNPFNDSQPEIATIEMDQSNIENCIKSTVDFYLKFCSDSRLFKTISFTNQPDSLKIKQSKTTGTPHQTALRYLAACAQFNEPADMATYQFFQSLKENHETYKIKLTSNFSTPQNYKVLALPLIHEQNLRVIVFDNFAPENVCKIIYYVLKHNQQITTIILKNYEDLNYHLFGFSKLINPSVISWTFTNLTFTEISDAFSLLQEFSDYHGAIQKLTLDQFTFTPAILKDIADMVPDCFCFRTLEILEIRNPKFRVKRDDEIQKSLRDFSHIASSLKVLQTFEITGWSSIYPSAIYFSSTIQNQNVMFSSTSLRHISFSNLDFRKVNFSFHFPIFLNVIELEKCYFNSLSLINLLKAAGEVRSPLILDLSLMKIDDNEKFIFYRKLNTVPKLINLIELDYSYNFIPHQFVRDFCKTFIPPNIKYVNISNCFELDKSNSLMYVLHYIQKNAKLWGLEIKSNISQTDFSSKMEDLFAQILKIKSIEHLDISGHKWVNTLGPQGLIEKMEQMPNLKYLNIEKAGFTEIDSLLQFYHAVLSQTTLEGINLPSADIDDILKRGQDTLDNVLELPVYKKLKDVMKSKTFPSTRVQRSCYYMRYTDMTKMPEFLTKFPVAMTTLKGVRYAQELITYDPRQFEIRTLLDLEMKEMNETQDYALSNFQAGFIESPIEDVEVKQQNIPKFTTSFKLMKYRPKYNPLLSSNRTHPVILPKINPREIISKYRGWICHKNQNLFSNLTLIPDLFEKVYNEETKAASNSMISNDEFGKNIPILEPPTFVPREAISIIHTQLENLGTNNDGYGEDNTHVSCTAFDEKSQMSLSQVSYRENSGVTSNPSFRSSYNSSMLTVPKKGSSDYDESSKSTYKRKSFKAQFIQSAKQGNDTKSNKVKKSISAKDRDYRSIRAASQKFCMNHFSVDNDQYDLFDEDDIDDADFISRQSDYNLQDLTVQQYSPKSNVKVDPKQQSALALIRKSATALSPFRTPRFSYVKNLPDKVNPPVSQDTEIFDSLFNLTRQYCNVVISNPNQTPAKQVKSLTVKRVTPPSPDKITNIKPNAMSINIDDMISKRNSIPNLEMPKKEIHRNPEAFIKASESDEIISDKFHSPFIPPPLSGGINIPVPLQTTISPPLNASISPPLNASIPPPLKPTFPPPLQPSFPSPGKSHILPPSIMPTPILQPQPLLPSMMSPTKTPPLKSFTPEINQNPKRDYADFNSFDVPDEIPSIEITDPSSIDPAPDSLVCEYIIISKPELPNLDLF